jgi:parvulin-like peptidyl-prolyl isomerase
MNFQGFLLFCGLSIASTLAPSHAQVVDRVEAIVNKSVVYKSDVDQFKKLAPLRMKVDPFFAADPLAKAAQPSPEAVINYYIQEKLVLDKFPINDSEVEQEISSIQSNLKIDRDSLRSAIAREGFRFEDYFQMMRASIAKRHLVDQEIRNKATVSDDDLRAEYNRSRAGSKDFRGSFRLHLIRTTKKNFKTAALAKASTQEPLQLLQKGEDFKSVAQKMSDDPSSSDGGDLGYLSYADMSGFLQKEVRKLGPGKTSGVLDDQNSFVILKVEDIKADVDSGFDREKEALRAKLLEGEFRHQIQLWLERQRAINYVKINSKS